MSSSRIYVLKEGGRGHEAGGRGQGTEVSSQKNQELKMMMVYFTDVSLSGKY